jgi:hypothetical protein
MSLAVSERNTTRWANALKSLKQGVSRRVIRDAEHFWQKVVLRFQHSQSLAVCGKAALHSRQAGKSGRRDGPEDWPWSSFLRYATGAEGRVEIESEWTARKRERAAGGLCPAVELPHSSQHRVLSGPARQVNELFSSLYNGEDGTIGSELIAVSIPRFRPHALRSETLHVNTCICNGPLESGSTVYAPRASFTSNCVVPVSILAAVAIRCPTPS